MIKTIFFHDRKNFYLLCLLVVYNGSFVGKSLCLMYVTHAFTYIHQTLSSSNCTRQSHTEHNVSNDVHGSGHRHKPILVRWVFYWPKSSFMNCHSDMLIFQKIKNGISERNSVLNNSLICCNGIMHCGTTIDNLEWMGRAARWSKFTATASVGMIHNKHLSESMNILSQHLPGSGGGPYQEGGALYALGLIHFGDNSDVTMARAYYGTLSIEQRRTYSWTTPIQAHIIESGNDRFPRPKYQNYDSNTSDLFIANESDSFSTWTHITKDGIHW